MSDDKTMQKMMDRFRIRITKTEQDSRSSYRGEKFIHPSAEEHDGEMVTTIDGDQRKMPYCIVPAHDPEYVKNFCRNNKYICSEPFIPGLDDKKPSKVEEGKK